MNLFYICGYDANMNKTPLKTSRSIFLISVILLSTFVLAGCQKTNFDQVNIKLNPVPFAWNVPKGIASHLSVKVPTGDFANQAKKAGATAQVLVYYTPDKGNSVIFMGVYYFPKKAFEATINPNEPPAFGSQVLVKNGMVLSIAGPQDSIFDPSTKDGKNIATLYGGITKPSSYTYSSPK